MKSVSESKEGEPVCFELVQFDRFAAALKERTDAMSKSSVRVLAVAPRQEASRDLIVTDVATDFRCESVNPLGEACRLIVALTVTFHAPRSAVTRLFRRYYVYEAGDFTPERLTATLRDMAADIETAAGEIRAGRPCTFDDLH